MENWQDMNTAPKNEAVLICPADCEIRIARQVLNNVKQWVWESVHSSVGGYHWQQKPLAWQPLPMPPKHLYERKLTADLLEKQVKQLRGQE